jgi:replication factor C large subunit
MGQAFSATGEFLLSSEGRRKLVVLDEADNLFGREDYGGAKAIVETIKESSQPIVLIVNDYRELTRKSPAIRSLADSIYFGRLTRQDVVRVLKGISAKEKVEVPGEVLERVAENANGDMRAAINDLQMLVEGRVSLVAKDSEVVGKRNQLKELDAALREMFGADSVKKARDATLDLDMTPDDLEKWIEESIPQEMPSPDDLAAAFEALARSDMFLGRTRRLQYYALWSYAKDLMTGGVALARKHGPRPYVKEYRFPGYFIVLSRAKGPRAARHAITSKMSAYFHAPRRVLARAVLPLLSVMVKNDRELLLSLIRELGLDESDVAFLIGTDPDDKFVEGIMTQAKGSTDSDDDKSKSKPSSRAKRSAHPF